MIYASVEEGFGIPPLESLSLGVPVIVTHDVPSIQALPPYGQMRLARPEADDIYDTMRQMLDDEFAAAKHLEVARLSLPTWQDCADALANWVEATVLAEPAVR
jgi:glycosyltransferase involved in cell wall biosynthesis